ncbi:hypothetical protein EVAR_79102_1 [Eumeta japonica]|uniref:Uncharacterized protein n=1 Tax=Eumeta variegata TaxID=151549 RepID=A0A4C1WZI9_EUMVA|nr:hypothetical protein EVAR_79102_1 [Eumeta japonica]
MRYNEVCHHDSARWSQGILMKPGTLICLQTTILNMFKDEQNGPGACAEDIFCTSDNNSSWSIRGLVTNIHGGTMMGKHGFSRRTVEENAQRF